jgi:hypothetical protein
MIGSGGFFLTPVVRLRFLQEDGKYRGTGNHKDQRSSVL